MQYNTRYVVASLRNRPKSTWSKFSASLMHWNDKADVGKYLIAKISMIRLDEPYRLKLRSERPNRFGDV